MRLLMVSNYQPPHLGGIEYAAEALKASWKRRGHNVTWLTSDHPPGAQPDRRNNIRLKAWNGLESMLEINTPLLAPWQRAAVKRYVRQTEIVNIHSLAPGVTEAARVFALSQKKPLVCTQHVGVIRLRQAWLNPVQRRVLIRAARRVVRGGFLTFVGEAVRDWFVEHAQLPEDRIAMTPAGINAEQFYRVEPHEREETRQKLRLNTNRLQVLFVGRFVEKKGLPILRKLAGRMPEVDFTLLGNGPDDPGRWGCDNVRVLEHVSIEVLRLLFGAHDLFIMPSHGEGWPAVVPQAMACGIPCLISTDCFDGFRRDRERFLVAERSAEAMQEAIQAAAGQCPGHTSQRAERSAYALETWNWDRTADIYLDLFVKAMQEH